MKLEADGKYISLDELHIVATAVYLTVTGYGLDEDTHPYCVGAIPILGLVKACLILEATANLSALTEDLDDLITSSGYVDAAIASTDKWQPSKEDDDELADEITVPSSRQ